MDKKRLFSGWKRGWVFGAALGFGCAGAPEMEGANLDLAGTALEGFPNVDQSAPGSLIDGRIIVMLSPAFVSGASASQRAASPLAEVEDSQNLDAAIDTLAREYGLTVSSRLGLVDGFVTEGAPASMLARLQRDERVAHAEMDQVMSASGIQTDAPWGLDRIDQATLPLNSTYQYDVLGAGVHVYVIDTGLRSTHTDFSGRVVPGVSVVSDGRGTGDCNGHGTHVSGTAVGSVYGVASSAKIVPVRVFGCAGNGSTSGIISALDWVAANAVRPAVANMSLGGGGVSSALDSAVGRVIAKGVTTVVAAGNATISACSASPARTTAAITVASTTSTDARSDFSNYGSCVDLFAPGSSILSADASSDTGAVRLSGTSMATPHVAGVAALYLGMRPTSTPAQVATAIVNGAVTGRVTDLRGTPNRLLNTAFLKR